MGADRLDPGVDHHLAEVGRGNLGANAGDLRVVIADFLDLGKGLGKIGGVGGEVAEREKLCGDNGLLHGMGSFR